MAAAVVPAARAPGSGGVNASPTDSTAADGTPDFPGGKPPNFGNGNRTGDNGGAGTTGVGSQNGGDGGHAQDGLTRSGDATGGTGGAGGDGGTTGGNGGNGAPGGAGLRDPGPGS